MALGVPLEQVYEARMKPSVCAGGPTFSIDHPATPGYNKNTRSKIAKYMYCEAGKMKDVCADCKRTEYCMEPCERWAIEHEKCPECGNKLIHRGGCTECITGDWAMCG